ncbi:tryptophan decarboxylase-like [Glandiceps talaboti]
MAIFVVSSAFALGAGAVRMENMLISWVANLIGYPAGHAGNLTSGGSAGTLLAVVAARHSKGVKGRDFERLVVYMTVMSHVCHQKVLNTAGLFEAIIRKVPIDENFRMKVDELRTLIQKDKEAGLLPFMIVGTLGTTDVGSIDPIDQIADVAEEYNLWFHVDAAYGGFFVLVDEYKPYFKGVNRTDSVAIDPHEGLFLPFGTGMVLVKRGYILRNANTEHDDAPYLQDTKLNMEEESPGNLTFEFTKHFRGMRMWLPLQLHGVKTFRKCLDEKIQLTRYLYAKLSELPGIVVGKYPQLTVITFHYETGKEEENEIINKKLCEKIREDGSVFLSSTTLLGKFRLRVCVLHYRCNQDIIDLFLAVLKEKLRDLNCH